MNTPSSFTVDVPSRLDTFLAEALNVTRNQVTHLIKQGAIAVDKKNVLKPGLKLKVKQSVVVTFPEPQKTEAAPIDFDVEILYEDDHLMVINKPSGLTVHPAPSVREPTLVDWLKHKGVRLSTISGEERHGIVHRLDKGTSGAMVIAKTNEAHEALSLQLQDKSMGRYYLAIITPILKDDIVMVDKPIGRSQYNRLKMAHVEQGKEAKTLFRKLLQSTDEKNELIACKLFTGRTHQIRVHLETFSRHILGDHLYGIKSNKDKIARIMLHAYLLYFKHPASGEIHRIVAPLPNEMATYLSTYFDTENIDEIINPDHIDRLFIPDTV